MKLRVAGTNFVGSYLLEPLAFAINESFPGDTFLGKLKISKIISVHKKGGPLEAKNYRFIVIPTATSKVFEKVVVLSNLL